MDLESILEIIRSHGDVVYLFLASYAASNSLLLPLFAGYAAQLGVISPGPAIACVWIGSVIGDQIRFAIGRRFGLALFDSLPRIRRGVEKAARLSDRHRWLMVIVCRYPHMVRSFAGFAFGMSRMPIGTFATLNVLSAAIWAPLLIGIGFAFGEVSEKALGEAAGQLSLALFVGFALLFWLLARRLEAALPVEADQGKRDSAYSHNDR